MLFESLICYNVDTGYNWQISDSTVEPLPTILMPAPRSVTSILDANEAWAHNMQEVEYQFNQALPAGAFREK